MDEWMDEAFRRAWMNYANKSLLDMGLITEQEYQKMAVKITNSPDRLRCAVHPFIRDDQRTCHRG